MTDILSRPKGALLLAALVCGNPAALLIIGSHPLVAIGTPVVLALVLHAFWRRYGLRLPTIYAVNFIALGGIWLHAEAVVRTRFHDYVMEDLYAHHGRFYFNRPGLRTHLTDKEYGVEYLTNVQGYRIGASQDAERQVGAVDWLFLGDSYTQGAQVPFDTLFTTQLYRRFPDRVVLNAGVSGWGLYEALAFLRERGTDLRPKVVFVQVANFNDFMKVGPRRAGFSDHLMQRSQFVRLLLQNIKYKNPTSLPLGRWVEPFYPTDDENRKYNVFYRRTSDEKEQDLGEVRRVIGLLADETRKLGARLVLIQLPTKEQVSFTYLEEAVVGLGIDPRLLDLEAPNRLLRDVADSLGIEVVDPLESWRQDLTFPYFHYDEHLSPDGHRMLSEVIAESIDRQGVSPEVQVLSDSYAGDRYPQFIGAGDTILFHSPRGGNVELLLADVATWTEERLTIDDVDETHPVPLPGGGGIVFVVGDAAAGTTSLWRSDLRGRGAQRVPMRAGRYAAIPAAFPDGVRLVFPSWGPASDAPRVQLTVLDLTTGQEQDLPQPMEQAWRPAVHPTGDHIVFIGRVSGQYDLFELDLRTGTTEQLTDTPYDEWDPTYTPDGREVVFAARADGNWDLVVMNRASRATRRLTRTLGDEWDPQVSPDGGTLVYAGEFGLMRGIYVRPLER